MSAFIPTRYPYTYSADHIRSMVGGCILSRAEAARLLTVFSEELGFDREEAAYTFADLYLKKYHPECLAEAQATRKKVDVNLVGDDEC